MCANKGSVDLWLPRDRDSAAALCTALPAGNVVSYGRSEGQMRCASITSCRENLYATQNLAGLALVLYPETGRGGYTRSLAEMLSGVVNQELLQNFKNHDA